MKSRGLLSILFDYAGKKKTYYVFSIITSLISVICGIIPFYFIASIINKLIDGSHDFNDFTLDIIMLLVFFLLKGGFHIISTSLSHIAAYQTIKGVRKRTMDSLALASLGDIKKQNSGAIKNSLCERIDSTETTLAHVIPEVSGSNWIFSYNNLFINIKLANGINFINHTCNWYDIIYDNVYWISKILFKYNS